MTFQGSAVQVKISRLGLQETVVTTQDGAVSVKAWSGSTSRDNTG